MFLYVAVIAALVGSADAAGFDNVRHVPAALDVQKYVEYAKEHAAEATAPHSRNLRDMVKPADSVYNMFRDPACTIPSMKFVRHGNTCYKSDHHNSDGSVTNSMAKFGCMVDGNNNVMLEYYDYGQSPDCAGQPLSMMTMPMVDGAGPCHDMGNGEYTRVSCSAKDPFRDAFGFHVLGFENGQVKECHDNSIKTNRALSHSFLTAGECISMDPGMSIMPVGCSGPHKVEFREDRNSETCANLGPVQSYKPNAGCYVQQNDDYGGNGNGGSSINKEFCVDASTGPQQ